MIKALKVKDIESSVPTLNRMRYMIVDPENSEFIANEIEKYLCCEYVESVVSPAIKEPYILIRPKTGLKKLIHKITHSKLWLRVFNQ